MTPMSCERQFRRRARARKFYATPHNRISCFVWPARLYFEWLWVRLGLKGVLVDHQLSGPRLQQKRNAPVPSCGENRRGYSDASIGTAHSPARYQYRQQACGPHSHRLGALTQRSAKYVRFPDRAIASEADKDSGEE